MKTYGDNRFPLWTFTHDQFGEYHSVICSDQCQQGPLSPRHGRSHPHLGEPGYCQQYQVSLCRITPEGQYRKEPQRLTSFREIAAYAELERVVVISQYDRNVRQSERPMFSQRYSWERGSYDFDCWRPIITHRHLRSRQEQLKLWASIRIHLIEIITSHDVMNVL